MTVHPETLAGELFLDAIELSGEERAAFLRERCGDDDELRRRVDSMIEFEERIPSDFLGGVAADVNLVPGTLVGAFEIVRRIGEGGMGTVYEALQRSPRREVALKVIRPGRATRDAVRRFRYEAEVLAGLQHPGIAQVYDAGTASVEGTDVELPYIAMELVRGEPLDVFADQRRLGRSERIELFTRVCDAVHHAHQRLVIHRDLKSENVLVVADDTNWPAEALSNRQVRGSGQPKVLDFGVARVLGSDGQRTLETRAGDLIGTVSTMSPEQVVGDPRIDVRSDVYSLGVILHRLLTGRFPLALDGLSVVQAIDRIRRDQPAALSRHDPQVPKDLELIVSRALEKDVERRTQSAADLAADLRRFLAGAPIRARGDSRFYVLAKTLRRYWAATIASASAVASLVIVAIVSSVQSERNATLSERLGSELEVSNLERGRLYAESGDYGQAADLIWPTFLASPSSRYARWSLWELYSRTPCLETWTAHDDFIAEVAMHPNGDVLASVGLDGRLVLYESNREPRVVDRVDGKRWSVAFHPSGDLLAVSEPDGRASLFAFPSGEPAGEVRAGVRPTRTVAFHPDGRLLTGGSDGELRVWDPSSGELLRDVEGHDDAVLCIAISKDGELIATAGEDPYLLLWNAGFDEPELRIGVDHRDLEGIAISEDHRFLATGGRDKRMRLFALPSGDFLGELSRANGFVEDLAFHPLEPYTLVSSGWWWTLFWDVRTREVVRALPIGSQSLVFRADGMLGLHNGFDVMRFDVTGRGVERLGDSNGRTACEASSDSDLIAMADEDGVVAIADLRTGERLREFRLAPGRVRSLSFSRDATRLAVGCDDAEDFVVVIDPSSGRELLRVADHSDVSAQSVALSGDGTLLAHTDRRQVRVVDVASAQVVLALEVDQDQALGVAFSPDGKRLATTSRGDNVARLWTLDGELLHDFQLAHTPWTPAFSPDGAKLAVGCWDKSVYVFDVETGALEHTLADHRAVVWDVAFHRTDPTLLASASDDGTIKLWDVSTGHRLATLRDYGSWEASGVSFASDPDVLVTSGRDGATLHSLGYYDRHVAGNVPHFRARFANAPGVADAAADVERWRRDEFARPWPSVTW